jgi:hypothetical protein
MRCGIFESFIVAFHNGFWRIGYMDQWYGAYPNKSSAKKATVLIAKEAGEVPTGVVVQEANRCEEVIFEPKPRTLDSAPPERTPRR